MSCCGENSAIGNGITNGATGTSKTSRTIASLKDAGAEFNKKTLFSVNSQAIGRLQASFLQLTLLTEQVEQLYTSAETNFSLDLPGKNGITYTLLLHRVMLYHPEFTVKDGNGNILDVVLGRHYFGIVDGKDNSQVVLNIFPNQVSGSIVVDGQKIEILRETIPVSTSYHLVAINELENKTFTCLVDESHIIERAVENVVANAVSANCARVYFDVDNSITNFFGGNVNDTTAYIESVFASVAATYLMDANVEATLIPIGMTIYTDATPPPFPPDLFDYSGYRIFNLIPGAQIYQFLNFGRLGGVAWIGRFCVPPIGVAGPFGISTLDSSSIVGGLNPTYPIFTWSTYVVAHEMGHTFGSRHTFDCGWNVGATGGQSLGGCNNGMQIDCVPCGSNPIGTCVQPGSDGYPFVSLNGPGLTGRTIMGYCNAPGSTSIYFGPQPGAVIRAAFDRCNECIVCLDENTLILLPNGSTKRICELKRGDYIATNLENTKSARISKVNIALYLPHHKMAIVTIAENALGPNIPNKELKMTEGHPIFYKGCRRSARCFKNFDGVTYYESSECQTIFSVNEEGMVLVYDLSFDDDGSYVANGTLVQSRSPWSVVTPLDKSLFFDESMYKEERTGDSLNHTVPRDWEIMAKEFQYE